MLNILMDDQYLPVAWFLAAIFKEEGDQIPDPFRASGLPPEGHFYTPEIRIFFPAGFTYRKRSYGWWNSIVWRGEETCLAHRTEKQTDQNCSSS
ncbi:TPA: hypothetical protein R4S16_004707 [Citrobacter amalonaticus]|nr:hypothetical protein [Citrobacter amalonaticus]